MLKFQKPAAKQSPQYADKTHSEPKGVSLVDSALSSMNNAAAKVHASAAPAGESITNALRSDKNPINKMLQQTNQNFGFFGIMMALAVLILTLMLGLAAPKSKRPAPYSRER